jgi:hypothetical protein
VPVYYSGVLANGPAIRPVGREDELEKAEVGETVGGDDISQEMRCSEALIWIGILDAGGFPVPRFMDCIVQSPARPRLDIVNDETVTREEDKLGIAV